MMKVIIRFGCAYILSCLLISSFVQAQVDGNYHTWVKDYIESYKETWNKTALAIWDYAELGYLEVKSSKQLQDLLSSNGFVVTAGVADIPTAFVATYGKGTPVIGVLGEYDALPGISQTVSTSREPIEGQKAGHACGHHLFGAGTAAAAIAVKQWMEKYHIKGTIKYFGCPAEEGGSGKVYMARASVFDGVDAMLHWHPGDRNMAGMDRALANKSGKFRFYGLSAHASAAPEKGKSALDAVEAMNFMANLMREHVPSSTRIHYVITSGGSAPNVVPDFAEVYYYVRHPKRSMITPLWDRLVDIAKGAAMGTDTKMEYEVIGGTHDLLPNEVLSRTMYANLLEVGGVEYTTKERAYAEKLHTTLETTASLEDAEKIYPFETRRGSAGSTDVGDVSWLVPTAGLRTATWVPGTSAHSWQAVAAGGMSIGLKGMLVAAKTLACTMTDLFTQPALRKRAIEELEEKRGADFQYHPLVGNRKPPLDYRK